MIRRARLLPLVAILAAIARCTLDPAFAAQKSMKPHHHATTEASVGVPTEPVTGAPPCPPCISPPRLTCEQLRARLISRKCSTDSLPSKLCEPAQPCDHCPVGSSCVDAKCSRCEPCPPQCPPGQTCRATDEHNDCEPVPCTPNTTVVPAEPVGRWLAGIGPVYFHGLGLTGVGGYRFANGIEVLGGPIYVPQNDTRGTATQGCVSIPFTVQGDRPWGAQVLAIFPLP